MANVFFRVRRRDGVLRTNTAKIISRMAATMVGSDLCVGEEIPVTPDDNGFVNMALDQGAYALVTQVERPVEFNVPDGDGTYSLGDLVSRGALLVPGITTIAAPYFQFGLGNLFLLNQTDNKKYAINLAADLSVNIYGQTIPGLWAQIEAGVVQLADPTGLWHSIALGGTADAPNLKVYDDSTDASLQARITGTTLYLPNVDAGGFHALLMFNTGGGPTTAPALAFGGNTP